MRKYKYLFFLIITAAIFASGMWVGEIVAGAHVDSIFRMQEGLQVSTSAIGLQNEILGGDVCGVDVFEITEDKFELGRALANLEAQRGYNDPDVILLKNKYSLYSIQQYLLVLKQRDECGSEVVPIFFFYDNANAKDDSQVQGYVLDYVYRTHPTQVATYALSMNAENAATKALMEKWDVDSGPTLVIEGEKYEGILEASEVFDAAGISS